MLTVDSLRARVQRFHQLCMGLAKETLKAKDIQLLHLMERGAYKQAIHDAIERLETARIVLATAIQRIEEGAAKSQSAEAEASTLCGVDCVHDRRGPVGEGRAGEAV
jgi:hypothetical protein